MTIQQSETPGRKPGGFSRRALATGAAALALAQAGKALAHDPQVITPRLPGKRPTAFAAVPATPVPASATAAAVGMAPDRLRRIHQILQRHVDDGTISGAVTAVARRGQLMHYEAHGYANAATRAPMPLNAIFRMASSTKPVAGVALMMMVEEGKVRLTDPVSRFIPEFRNTQVVASPAYLDLARMSQTERQAAARSARLEPARRPITVLDLATHTSGLVSGGIGGDIAGVQRRPGETLATYIPRLGAVPLDFQPGTLWRYSGGAGIDILGRIVEIASGQDFDSFLRTRIFEPIGMVDTHFNLPAGKRSRLLPQQRRANGQWQVTPSNPNAAPTVYFSGAGGLQSTCADYLRFEQMLVNKGELNGRRLLGSRTVELMGTNHVGDLFVGTSGRTRGTGFGITVRTVTDFTVANTGRSNGGFGWGGAFGTMSWTDPAEEIAGVIMLQQMETQVQVDFEKAVRQAIID